MRKRAFNAAGLGVLAALALVLAGCPGDGGAAGGTAPLTVTTADVFMLRFNNNPNAAGTPDYKYCVESFIDDPNLVISSASLTGMGNTSAYAYNSSSRKWWDDSGSRYCTQLQPVFPMAYTIFIKYIDGRTATLSRTVSSWSIAP